MRYTDPDTGRVWRVKHEARSDYAIHKKCSPKAFEGGWNRLGTITRWTDGYHWHDLAGTKSRDTYKTQTAALQGFIAEMGRRRAANDARKEQQCQKN